METKAEWAIKKPAECAGKQRKASGKPVVKSDLNVYQLCWSHEVAVALLHCFCIFQTAAFCPLDNCRYFSRCKLPAPAPAPPPLQPVWVRKVTVDKWVNSRLATTCYISGNWRAACNTPVEATRNWPSWSCNMQHFDLCNRPAVYVACPPVHFGSISSSRCLSPLWAINNPFPLIAAPHRTPSLHNSFELWSGHWSLETEQLVGPLGVCLIADASPPARLLIYALRNRTRRVCCSCNRRRVRFMGAQTRMGRHCN